jgi:fatty acid desaturase
MQYSPDYSFTDAELLSQVRSAKPSSMRTLFDLFILCWAEILLAMALFLYCPSIWTYLIVFLCVSSRMNGCLTLAHDAWHGSLMASKKWNDFFGGWLCSYPFGSVFGSARAGHLKHHKTLGTAEDPDGVMHSEADKATPSDFIDHFVSHMFVGQLISTVKNHLAGPAKVAAQSSQTAESNVVPAEPSNKKSGAIPEFAKVVLVQAIIGCTLWVASGHFWMYFLVWFAPIVTLGTLCYFIRSFCDHARLASDKDGPYNGRLVSIPSLLPIERAFISPFEFNFHAEHHLFASVPHQHLPKLHKSLVHREGFLKQCIVRTNYTSFLLAYWRDISDPEISERVQSHFRMPESSDRPR